VSSEAEASSRQPGRAPELVRDPLDRWRLSCPLIQEFLGHKDVKTTMLDKHVLNRSGGRGVRSPADILWSPVLRLGGILDSSKRRLTASRPVLLPSRQIEAGELDGNDWDASDEDV
jgi:hypothetical protein